MIIKEVVVELTSEEINSTEPIEIRVVVVEKGTDNDEIVYTITYSKGFNN